MRYAELLKMETEFEKSKMKSEIYAFFNNSWQLGDLNKPMYIKFLSNSARLVQNLIMTDCLSARDLQDICRLLSIDYFDFSNRKDVLQTIKSFFSPNNKENLCYLRMSFVLEIINRRAV
jgi:hypothetical protein